MATRVIFGGGSRHRDALAGALNICRTQTDANERACIMIIRCIAKRVLCVAATAAMFLCTTSTACASHHGPGPVFYLAVIVALSFALAAVTVGIFHALTKNKRVWWGLPIAAIVWGLVLYELMRAAR